MRIATRLSLALGLLGALVVASAWLGLHALSDAEHVLTQSGASRSSVAAAREDLAAKRTLLMVALAAGAAGAIGGIAMVRRRVGRPMWRLLAGVERLKGGDFRHEVPVATDDEFGRMASSLNDVIARRLGAHDELEFIRHRDELILAAVGEGIFALDADGLVTAANPAAARMLGYSAEEMVGRLHHEVVHDSDHDVGECPLNLMLRDGHARHAGSDKFYRKDGSGFAVEYTSGPIVEDGETRGAVILFRDVTERRAVERMKDEFVSIVSHELRTPLTSIRGALGLIATGMLGDVPERGRRMLEIAITNSDRLVRLINDILDIERIDSGAVAMDMQVCNAANLLTQATETMRNSAQESGVTLAAKPVWAQVNVDPDRMHQALTNLLSNAIKFSDWGGRVWITAEHADDELIVKVGDQGRGIPAGRLESIFERFQQVDASDAREKGGTGLGLSICKSIVMQHGGRIWAESVVGKGSTFYIALPLVNEVAVRSEDATVAPDPGRLDHALKERAR